MKFQLAALMCAALLGGCAASKPPTDIPVELAPSWSAPTLAHQGSTAELQQWWGRFNDPVLSDWIARAQTLSPTIASARAQVAAARAGRIGAESASGPQAAAVAGAQRGVTLGNPLGTSLSAGVQASWEADLWGGAQARSSAALANEQAANAGWHEARVLVASETARLYFAQRLCRDLLAVSQRDRDSRAATARSTGVSESAGLTAPAVAALARASAADAAARHDQQAEQCERQVKSLTALTGVAEPEVRRQLDTAPPLLGHAALNLLLGVQAVPAEVIRQRPDVYRAQRSLEAASEAVGVARAALLPSLSLSGSLLRYRVSLDGANTSFNTWSIGPISLSLPLLGRGALRASEDSALAQYQAAAKAYAATLRQAVSEVEQALVGLASLGQRVASTQVAVAGYNQSFTATEARHRVGLASLNELEDARRLKLGAESGAVNLQLERLNAWIELYVALGGGFDANDPPIALKNPS